MKKKAKPVTTWETKGRNSGDDPRTVMDSYVKPNYPTNIQKMFNELDDDLKTAIKKLFTQEIEEIEDCGEFVFVTCDDFDDLSYKFEEIQDETAQQKFTDMFFNLNILDEPKAKPE